MTTNRIHITGRIAAEIRSIAASIAPSGQWTEVRLLDECNYGCKLHVRTVDGVAGYALLHSATYGCPLGRSEATAAVDAIVGADESSEETAERIAYQLDISYADATSITS